MSDVEPHFDDPHLKQAVKRLWCSHEPSAGLRDRVGKIVNPCHAIRCGRMVAIFVVVGAVVVASVATWSGQSAATNGEVELASTIADGFVHTHDRCCTVANHHFLPGLQPNDIAGAGRYLADQLQVAVIAPPLANWQFDGAGGCPVWGHESAHLLYHNGNQRLSVFTIPAQDFDLDQNGKFVAQNGNHYLAGFLRTGGLYCVLIQSPENSADAAAHLRDQLLADYQVVAYLPGQGQPKFADSAPIKVNLFHLLPLTSLFPSSLIAYHRLP